MDYNKYFEGYPKDKGSIIYLIDKVKQSQRTWETEFTHFLTPEEQIILKKICCEDLINVEIYGGIGECERGIGAIYKEDLRGSFPISILKISGNFKFEKLNHRDYLGAVLSLGITRDKIGDINVFEDGAEIYVHSDICSYIELNLNKIKHTGIKTSIIELSGGRKKIQEFNDLRINITSPRLDCVVSAILNTSRAKAVSIIKSGEVKLNYSVTEEICGKIKIGDLISLKGFGRIRVDDILGVTKSDRLTLLVKKYL